MNRTTLKLSTSFFAVLLCAIAASAPLPAYTNPGPIPPALLSAKSIFVSNGGSDNNLFPYTFTGDANRPYSEFYSALKAAGKYDLVSDPSQADLVLYVRMAVAYCPSTAAMCLGSSGLMPIFRLTVYDRKTHYVLWTVTEPIESALLLKNYNRNFDNAISALVDKFERITSKSPSKQ